MAKRDAGSRAALLKELETLMVDVSEEHFSAGWLCDLEFWLWEEISRDDWDSTVGVARRLSLPLFQLAQASALLGGWLRWDENVQGAKFVPHAKWVRIYAIKGRKKEKKKP
jgi:hypothetical protein